ncbi:MULTISPECIES: tRNA (adenosine(37)-N6)-threonylcarbamoyltransferase complex transferase subunit TsaD [Rhodomicrobium]|uniref:tRNA (adenosine(37)-N6)-threonylcarbamoyltransferase complex transferase subunit TsaD n=1 Tax=Rhodomicrobium TaxID=1068 RepID=UPI000B4B6014|nr:MULTISPECIES: tRNA (adenosine(37)-N6)-threonylcarbamoyltransferase complex transferase subunit TsaD [Rhodomicrobium]
MTVLGIETSCDETGVAVIERHADGSGAIRVNLVRSQLREHAEYGGVVPEIAARAHVEALDGMIAAAMREAGLGFADLSAIAVTAGPGLIGGLLVGAVTAKAIGLVHKLPVIPVNHLEGHALTVGLTEGVAPPYLLLLVSGGHTQLLAVNGVGDYRRLGTTLDDALGEAFDKTAKLLGLGFPGGPEVERWAVGGDPRRFALPRPMLGRPEPHFSFSGLKTALRLEAKRLEPLREQDIRDLCASFEEAIAQSVIDRITTAMAIYIKQTPEGAPLRLVAAGGVAANMRLRAAMAGVAAQAGFSLHVPPIALCGDNAAMIAWAGAERLAHGLPFEADFSARARWPLDGDAPKAIGAGVKA